MLSPSPSPSCSHSRSLSLSLSRSLSLLFAYFFPFIYLLVCVCLPVSLSPLFPLSSLPVPSSPPRSLTGRAAGPRSLSLSWQAPATPNGRVVQYLLNVTDIQTGNEWQVVTRRRRRTLDWLRPYNNYTLQVAAVTSAGAGPFSAPLQLTTLEDGMLIWNLPVYIRTRKLFDLQYINQNKAMQLS